MALTREILEVWLTAKDELTAKLRTAGQAVNKFSGTITALSTGFLAVSQIANGVGRAMDNVVMGSVRLARELGGLERRLGISSSALQEIKYIAEQSGVSFSTMAMALQRSTRRIAEAAQGMGEAKGALAELRLNAELLARLSPDRQFEILADALAGVTDQADRVRLAFKFFDADGVRILETFGKGGAADLRKLKKEWHGLNAEMTPDQLATLEQYERVILKLGAAWRGAAVDVAAYFANYTAFLRFAGKKMGVLPGGGGEQSSEIGSFLMDPRKWMDFTTGGPRKMPGTSGLDIRGPVEEVRKSLGTIAPILEKMDQDWDSIEGHMLQTVTAAEALEWHIDDANRRSKEMGATLVDAAAAFGDGMGDAIVDALEGIQSFGSAVSDMIRNIADQVIRELVRIAAKQAALGFIAAVASVFTSGAASGAVGAIRGGSNLGPSTNVIGGSPGAAARRESTVLNVTVNSGFASRAAGIDMARTMARYLREAGAI